METQEFAALIERRLSELDATPMGAARRASLPRDAIRSVYRGHEPGLTRVAEICRAIGLELYIGRQNERDDSAKLNPLLQNDPELADMLRALALAWGEAEDRGRLGLRIRFWAHFPDLQPFASQGDPAAVEEPEPAKQSA